MRACVQCSAVQCGRHRSERFGAEGVGMGGVRVVFPVALSARLEMSGECGGGVVGGLSLRGPWRRQRLGRG